jgi:hypothetical protein
MKKEQKIRKEEIKDKCWVYEGMKALKWKKSLIW